MSKHLLVFAILTGVIVGFGLKSQAMSGAPPYGIPKEEVPFGSPAWIENWVRPEGPPKVALQVGHWKNTKVPQELENLKNNTGASAADFTEVEVNLAIAEAAADILQENGVDVEILPTTIPPRYWADVFVAIHADGSTNKSKRGYKFAGPWRDLTGKSNELVKSLEQSYEDYTDFEKDPNITRNMRGYYAFSWWRYEHSLHPMTTAVIAETGFLTNYYDRLLIVEKPEIPAQAIAEGIINYLHNEELF